MLSYMVPSIEDKPPPAPKSRLQLEFQAPRLTNGHALVNGNGTDMLVTTEGRAARGARTAATLSTESSASSLSSGVGELPHAHAHAQPDKLKPKLITNGGTKHQSLKRVSFGSSKGSMVETLIYESPVQEEPEVSPSSTPHPDDPDHGSQSEAKHPSRVRVTFFEQDRPLVVSSPEPELSAAEQLLDESFIMTAASPLADHGAPYHRQASTDSGWDNPFRPDGDLSREADEIVELIKGGKPITPTPGGGAATAVSAGETVKATATAATVTASAASPVNGSKPSAGAVELQRATVSPGDAGQVEHVVLKKKPGCKCCVLQ